VPWLNLAAFVACTESEGPGRRAALWVQGCGKRCFGCCNPEYLAIVEREIVPAESVVAKIARAKQDFGIEGVTFLGGEPMLQAKGLAHVARACRDLDLSVMVFSGYTLDELARLAPAGGDELLSLTDVLVDGPYLAAEAEHRRNWTGSTNQRFHYFTERYDSTIESAPDGAHSVELQVGIDGVLRLNGWPTRVV